LQRQYAFTPDGLTNHWTNEFADRSAAMAAISDADALAYIRQDNYTPLLQAMQQPMAYYGWRPDLDLEQGFDAEGYARDGSWWRAFRYKPFLGTFWPTNGSTDDVIIRLPAAYYTGSDGRPSRAIYKINLAIAEAAMTVSDAVADADVVRTVEPVSEDLAGMDLDGDGHIGGMVTTIRGLPAHYVANLGTAGSPQYPPVLRWQYPAGTEFLHTVRYIDPDAPDLLSVRLKEVRYALKFATLSSGDYNFIYGEEARDASNGLPPSFGGTALTGLNNNFGWLLDAFIEDEQGRLRLQTYEEHFYCLGCHSGIGVTADFTFGFPRKVPGALGWGHQSIAGMQDVAQAGQLDPEILTYFRRVGGGDEFRSNDEISARFFPGGTLDEATVRRAAPGGDQDLAFLLAPSRTRALALDKAYMALVREQSFVHGRDAVLAPRTNVYPLIAGNGDTGLSSGVGVFDDGRIWLAWPAP
ncbi:MAG TPA: hypothetical protein VHE37_06040, partial [Nevskiaceae bacterium]|nr:hypothetical protein [Nevskiaceae bacterium]